MRARYVVVVNKDIEDSTSSAPHLFLCVTEADYVLFAIVMTMSTGGKIACFVGVVCPTKSSGDK
jgi:hypothetical protein